jgi:hypothetical protein
MKRTLLEKISASLVWIGVSVINPSIAFADQAIESPSETVVTESSDQVLLPDTYVADGNLVAIDALKVAVAGPKGWTVSFNNGTGPSIVMEEEKVLVSRKIKKPVTTYQRNITMSVKHEGSPIDEKRAALLTEQLTNQFSKQSVITNFAILETKMIDLNEGKKAIMAYSSFSMNNVEMMQMHLLTSNEETQYLQTYTDMAKRFSPQDSGFSQAWETMASMQINGKAPVRYQKIMELASVAGGSLLFLFMLMMVGRRKKKKYFERSISDLEADEYSDEQSAVSSANWAFEGRDEYASEQALAVTQVSPLDQTWAVSSPAHSLTANSQTSESSDWVVPMKTRVSPVQYSSHA